MIQYKIVTTTGGLIDISKVFNKMKASNLLAVVYSFIIVEKILSSSTRRVVFEVRSHWNLQVDLNLLEQTAK